MICSIAFQNAFPVSGQLYTTHLLSLEALLTVIDSTEAHCQAKVMNRAAEQELSETLTAEGEASVDSTKDAVKGLNFELSFRSHKVFVIPLLLLNPIVYAYRGWQGIVWSKWTDCSRVWNAINMPSN